MKLRTALDHFHAHLCAIVCLDKSLAQQQFKDEADPVYIAERFKLTGELPTVLELPRQGDYTGVFNFQTAMNAVVHGQRQFMSLPAKMRARFENDPQQLLDFLQDPNNKDEAIRLGLIPKPKEEQPPTPVPAPAPVPTPNP